MAKLTIKYMEAIVGEYPLTKTVTTIGRAPGNDIVIDHPAVSAWHARLEKEGEQYLVEDVNSTNGTRVNGQRIVRTPLPHQATLTIGRHTLIFDDPKVLGDAADATMVIGRALTDATMVIDVRAPLQEKKKAADATMIRSAPLNVDADATMIRSAPLNVDADATMIRSAPLNVDADATMIRSATKDPAQNRMSGTGLLTIIEGESKGVKYPLTKRVTNIGAAENAEIRIKGLFAPKVAAMINRTAAGYVLTPLPKELQPLLNGKAIETATQLQHLDIIQVINLKLQFSV
ncbi:MAG: FHA domain-containing protein [Desulfuromonadales bacterium]|nr:FHA domain-containing protein [Desulfuromonadales bacterium]